MEYQVGGIYDGKVKTITNFGAFIALPGNRTGMVHISEIAYSYVSDIRQFHTEGQDVRVQILSIDDSGKINLSIKRAQPRQESPSFQRKERTAEAGAERPRDNAGTKASGSAPARFRSSASPEPQVKPYSPQPSGNQAFEDKLKAFMSQSDSRLADARQYKDRKTKTRIGRRK